MYDHHHGEVASEPSLAVPQSPSPGAKQPAAKRSEGRSRTRRVLFVSASVVFALSVASWALSVFYSASIGYTWTNQSQIGASIVEPGHLFVVICGPLDPRYGGRAWRMQPAGWFFELWRFHSYGLNGRSPYSQNRSWLGSAILLVEPPQHPRRELQFDIPTWMPLLLSSLVVALLTFGEHRRRRLVRARAAAGLCRTCGYDVRASSDTCPECGSPKPGQAAAERFTFPPHP